MSVEIPQAHGSVVSAHQKSKSREEKHIMMTWVDIAIAYGSVPHWLIT